MSKEGMRITITFKENERYLYEDIKSHSNYGGFVKDVLKENYEKQKKETPSADMVSRFFE